VDNLNSLRRVLVVEDEALIAMDVMQTLEEAGVAETVHMTTVEGALAEIESSHFDAAVLDLHLGRSGWTYDVAKRRTQKGVPFIFTSGTSDIAEGFRDVPLIGKPYRAETLLEALLGVSDTSQTVAAQ
jgi:DNA-binding response OmpR family regulator